FLSSNNRSAFPGACAANIKTTPLSADFWVTIPRQRIASCIGGPIAFRPRNSRSGVPRGETYAGRTLPGIRKRSLGRARHSKQEWHLPFPSGLHGLSRGPVRGLFSR